MPFLFILFLIGCIVVAPFVTFHSCVYLHRLHRLSSLMSWMLLGGSVV